MSYHFYLANGLRMFQVQPLDFQALYHSGGGVCALLELYFGGVCWGVGFPWGGTHTYYFTLTTPTSRNLPLQHAKVDLMHNLHH